MVKMRLHCGIFVLACVMLAGRALAEESPAPPITGAVPVSAGNFIPLQSARAHTQLATPHAASAQPAHFMVLSPRMFRSVPLPLAPHTGHQAEAPIMDEASLQEISARAAVHKVSGHGMMSTGQAQQILSIFDPGN